MILKVDPLTAKVSPDRRVLAQIQVPCVSTAGEEPTIADCDAILRRLNPDYFQVARSSSTSPKRPASSRRNAPTGSVSTCMKQLRE